MPDRIQTESSARTSVVGRIRRTADDSARYEATERLLTKIAVKDRQRRTYERRRRGQENRLRLRGDGDFEYVEDGNERHGRYTGPDLLLVIVEALHKMRQARPRFVTLRARRLVRLGAKRMNRYLTLPLPRQIR